ncbi:hypothetical protein EB796_018116 [Bugula neritina]|uniref:Uncharacterized protein n=1 Tax=Bugula neritina TaxID=10212 RepID=A0A7J7JDX5_BUGNE|nr:hypothetical protein EB796_018116 [Bugula neritina]
MSNSLYDRLCSVFHSSRRTVISPGRRRGQKRCDLHRLHPAVHELMEWLNRSSVQPSARAPVLARSTQPGQLELSVWCVRDQCVVC